MGTNRFADSDHSRSRGFAGIFNDHMLEDGNPLQHFRYRKPRAKTRPRVSHPPTSQPWPFSAGLLRRRLPVGCINRADLIRVPNHESRTGNGSGPQNVPNVFINVLSASSIPQNVPCGRSHIHTLPSRKLKPRLSRETITLSNACSKRWQTPVLIPSHDHGCYRVAVPLQELVHRHRLRHVSPAFLKCH